MSEASSVFSPSRAHAELNTVARAAGDALHFGLQDNFDTFVGHQFEKRVGNIRVFAFEELRRTLDDRNTSAESAHGLGEFQADITSTEDDEVLGQTFQVQSFDMRHRCGKSESGHVGNAGPGADIDEDALAAHESCAAGVQRHFHGFRFREARFAHDQLRAACFEIGEVDFDKIIDHLPFATSDAGHVYFAPVPLVTPRPVLGRTSEMALAL